MQGIFSGIQNLISGIKTIVNAIILAFEFLWNMIKSIKDLFVLIGTTLGNVLTIIATLPSWLIAFATASIGIAVLYLVVGRDTGK